MRVTVACVNASVAQKTVYQCLSRRYAINVWLAPPIWLLALFGARWWQQSRMGVSCPPGLVHTDKECLYLSVSVIKHWIDHRHNIDYHQKHHIQLLQQLLLQVLLLLPLLPVLPLLLLWRFNSSCLLRGRSFQAIRDPVQVDDSRHALVRKGDKT